ncbi:MAG: polysaccharide pyruvyl transferase family protein [Verrucomicrobia bacterium]|nr:polysaccharide pyruvyl transferase family protein [Verrucomicrobiota bacterium]
MNLRYLLPSARTTNFGDYVIHHSVEQLLARFVPRAAGHWDIESGRLPEIDADCLLVPGITHLTAGERPALERLGELPLPAYCLSGCIWQPAQHPGFLLRTRVLRWRQVAEPDTRVARAMRPPVGARDPFTYECLRRAGIETLYTGCATLLMPAEGVADDGYVLFSLGRGHVREQTLASRLLAREHTVVGICHEDGDEERYRAAGWELPLVNWRGDVELYLSYFKRASTVVTGRLHGALPALAFGKRVFYFGTRDTRTSLFDDLGVPIHDWSDLPSAVRRASADFNRALPGRFLENWQRLLEHIVAESRRQGRGVRPESSPVEKTSPTSCVHA